MKAQKKYIGANMASIYIVVSYNGTFIGKVIKNRAKLNFGKQYCGSNYSHVSLALDPNLNNMISFARKKLNNPLISGLIRENIRTGVFAMNSHQSQIAVMKIDVTKKQYQKLKKQTRKYWKIRSRLRYNFLGLFSMLLFGKGVEVENHYFCSQWVDEVLKRSGLDLFDGKPSCNIRPFDFYGKLKENIIYEGATIHYPNYHELMIESSPEIS